MLSALMKLSRGRWGFLYESRVSLCGITCSHSEGSHDGGWEAPEWGTSDRVVGTAGATLREAQGTLRAHISKARSYCLWWQTKLRRPVVVEMRQDTGYGSTDGSGTLPGFTD